MLWQWLCVITLSLALKESLASSHALGASPPALGSPLGPPWWGHCPFCPVSSPRHLLAGAERVHKLNSGGQPPASSWNWGRATEVGLSSWPGNSGDHIRQWTRGPLEDTLLFLPACFGGCPLPPPQVASREPLRTWVPRGWELQERGREIRGKA